MSDYLGNLVARSLDPVPAVRPRLASRFEPRAPAAAPLLAAPMEEPEPAVERRAEARVDARVEDMSPAVSPAGLEPRGAAPSPAKRGRVGEGASVPAASTPSPTLPRAGARERAPSTHPGNERFAPEPPVPSSVTGEQERSRTVPTAKPAALGTPLRLDLPSPVRQRTAGEASRADRPAHEEPRSAVKPVAAGPGPPVLPPPREPVSRPVPPVALPQAVRETPPDGASPAVRDLPEKRQPVAQRFAAPPLQPLILERPSPPVRAETPAAEPIIQISIGRIEVRAPQAPAQAARSRPPAPSASSLAPSLEDYLRRRSRRGDG